jgi:hypothetical protein
VGQTALTTGILVPVMITLSGTSLTNTGSITGLQAVEATSGQPPLVRTTVENTGNHHYYGIIVNVTLADTSGNVVAAASTPRSVYALIPGNSMTIATPITTTLAPGTYTVKSEAKLADGMIPLDTKSTTLTITKTYVPPATQATAAVGTQAATGGAEGPKKIPFLPIYIPGPDALATVSVVGAMILLWSAKRRR